jgi:hypothetical protein
VRRAASDHASDEGAPSLEGPVRCLLVHDGRVWVAGGRSEPWIALFCASTGGRLARRCAHDSEVDHCVQILAEVK